VNGLFGKFGRFLAVGAVCTALQYAILVALVQLSAASAALASSIGFAAAACVNYIANYLFTFRSDSPHAVAAPRFAATALAGLLQTYAFMWVLVQHLHVNYLVAQVATTGVVLAFNFVTLSCWTYVSPRR
jgi:putative flippase GtrA